MVTYHIEVVMVKATGHMEVIMAVVVISGENLSPIPIYGGNGNGTGMGMGLKFSKMGLSGTEFLGMIEVFK